MGKRIKVLIIEPGKAPRQARVSSTPEEIQKIIGGYVEETHVCEDLVVLSRSDGWFCDLKACCEICGAVFFGTVILCGKQKGAYSDLPLTWDELKELLPQLWVGKEERKSYNYERKILKASDYRRA